MHNELNWTQLAVPREDGKDTQGILGHLTNNPIPKTPRIADGERSIFGGQTAVRYTVLSDELAQRYTDAPFNHPNIATAEQLIAQAWPAVYRQFQEIIYEFQPVFLTGNEKSGHFGSMSHQPENRYGSVWATVNDPICLAQAFVHEMAHNKLFAVGQTVEMPLPLFLNESSEEYDSPVRFDIPRPISAIFHGLYAFTHILSLDRRLLGSGLLSPEDRQYTKTLLVKNVRKVKIAIKTIKKCALLSQAGATFVSDAIAWAEKEIRLSEKYEIEQLELNNAVIIVGAENAKKTFVAKRLSELLDRQYVPLNELAWSFWYQHAIVQRCLNQIFGESRVFLLNRVLQVSDKRKLITQLIDKSVIRSEILDHLKLELLAYAISRFPNSVIDATPGCSIFKYSESINRLKSFCIDQRSLVVHCSPIMDHHNKLEVLVDRCADNEYYRIVEDQLRNPSWRTLADCLFDSDSLDYNNELMELSKIFSRDMSISL